MASHIEASIQAHRRRPAPAGTARRGPPARRPCPPRCRRGRPARGRGCGPAPWPCGQQAHLGVHDGGVGPPVGGPAVLAVARDRAVDDVGPAGGDLLVADAEAGGDAGPEVLDDHVAALGQIEDQVDALGSGQVDRQEPLAHVLAGEQHRQAAPAGVAGAQQVALGRLDLEHLGPEVGQHPGARRAGHDPGEVEDPDPLQDAGTDPGARGDGSGLASSILRHRPSPLIAGPRPPGPRPRRPRET